MRSVHHGPQRHLPEVRYLRDNIWMQLKNLHLLGFGLALATTASAQNLSADGGWRLYEDTGGYYKVNYPATWQVLTRGNALVITSPGGPEIRGVFGITPRPEGTTVQDAVNKEFQDPEHSPDLKKAPARIANRPAVKVWGSKKGDPNIRMVEYYIEEGSQQFYILFQAPHAGMDRFGPIFEKMIATMKFLK
jgi:hypothetical protein